MAMRTPDCHSSLLLRSRWTAFALVIPIAAAACGSAAHRSEPGNASAPLKLLAAGATEAAMRDQIGAFQTQTGLSVDITFGAVGALRDQVVAGAAADVVIVTPAIITTLDAQQRVHAGSRVDLGRIGGGVAVKAGTAAPAIATAEQLKQTLLDADEIYYADPATATAGAALMKVVDALGIGDQVRSKGHTAPGGKDAMRSLARSTAAHPIGVTQVSEILSVPEVTLVGEYPGTLQVKTTYSAIILERSARLEDARKLVQFLIGPAFQARLARSGFEPVPAEPSRTQ
jgi:molybdate transport system substrate-binding protein